MSEIHRVRSVIRYIEYNSLQKILPEKEMFTGIKLRGNMPRLARKIGHTQFGMFLDWFIRKIMCNFPLLTSIPVCDLCVQYFGNSISKKMFEKDNQYYLGIYAFVQKEFSDCKFVEVEPEWTYGIISGHPDLVIDGVIYVIKTTEQFNSVRTEIIIQLLTYYCLGKLLKKDIHSIGMVLPVQNRVMIVDMCNWDWYPFWNVVNKGLETKIKLSPSEEQKLQFKSWVRPYIGFHVDKDKTINRTLSGLPMNLPWQIFLAGKYELNFNISESDMIKTRALVNEGYRFYIQSPYTLNLSCRSNLMLDCLINHLKAGVIMGCRGIIVRCGVKTKDIDYDVAYENMYQSVVDAAPYGSSECRLLIETSAKETGELLSNPRELCTFYYSLPEEIRQNVAICMNTCHVFSAGYVPIEFVSVLEENNVPTSLIHYNDSKGVKGCCNSRSVSLGTGYVGFDNLNMFGSWARINEIDMIHE